MDQNTWRGRCPQVFTANPTNSFEVLLKRHDFPFSSFYLAFVYWPKALPDTLDFLGVFLKTVPCWLLCLTQESCLPLLFSIPFFPITTNTGGCICPDVFLTNSNKKERRWGGGRKGGEGEEENKGESKHSLSLLTFSPPPLLLFGRHLALLPLASPNLLERVGLNPSDRIQGPFNFSFPVPSFIEWNTNTNVMMRTCSEQRFVRQFCHCVTITGYTWYTYTTLHDLGQSLAVANVR